MKTVFNNAQTIHVWAAQTQPEGRNGNGTMRFEGPALYSYATPVALILPDAHGESVALITCHGYSPTTAGKHKPDARDVAPRPVFYVPYLPGLRGGRYEAPRRDPDTDNATACHAGNLAHLVAKANARIARAVALARRTGRPVPSWHNAAERDWTQDSAWIESEWSDDSARQAALDYARRFNLPAPVFAPDYGKAEIMAACRAWHEREADPKLQRKRAADRARRAARAAWVQDVAGPILAEAGIGALSSWNPWDRRDAAEALRGIPATDAGASALRARLADRIARNAADMARWKAEEDARREREAAERAAKTARAAAFGFTLDEWCEMFGSVATAERWNAAEDVRKAIPERREAWRRGEGWQEIPGEYAAGYDVREGWRQCERGGDILRIKPGEPGTLESARGAEVPTDHARRAWRHILRVMCAGESWSGAIRCGHFTITEVTPEWMVAGCHRFHRAEMERVAALLGEPVTCDEINANKESVA